MGKISFRANRGTNRLRNGLDLATQSWIRTANKHRDVPTSLLCDGLRRNLEGAW